VHSIGKDINGINLLSQLLTVCSAHHETVDFSTFPLLVYSQYLLSQVMKTLVHFGALKNILVDGKPHLGTDRLIPLLCNFRQHLLETNGCINISGSLGISSTYFQILL
jgi:hypothetical protein